LIFLDFNTGDIKKFSEDISKIIINGIKRR